MYIDGCYPLLELGEYYRRGLLMYERIKQNINGRIACHRETCGVIAEVVSRCQGDHLEIGTLFGGTAIVAALAKILGKVYTIDPMTGYYEYGRDPETGLKPTPELLLKNCEKFKVQDIVQLVVANSNPFPGILESCEFDTALIDGDHTYEGAKADWDNLRIKINRYIMFDNIDTKHPQLVKVFKEACADEHWKPVLIWDICGVLERV